MGMLEGKICLVTGAGGGIGSAICEAFVREGAEAVAAVEHRSGTVDAWKAECDCGDRIVPFVADIQEEAQVRGLVMDVRGRFGRIDVIVNAAGIEYNERIGFVQYEHMRQMFAVNVFGTIELLQYGARVMMRQKCGSIINIASVVGVHGNPGQAVYSASKGAIISLTKSAAKELAPQGIRVNAIAPGLTDTKMIRQTPAEILGKRVERISMGRMAQPREIAEAAVFLASDRSEYVSGQILGVDGATVM